MLRFFAHDGMATHGPATVDELLKLPRFDGDTLVCPVGSSDSADWKPALAYPAFKQALLAPAPTSAPLPPPPPPARPAPEQRPAPVRLLACPRCAKPGAEDARYCSACGARMDGIAPEPAAPAVTLEPIVPLEFGPARGAMGSLGSVPSAARMEPPALPMASMAPPHIVERRPPEQMALPAPAPSPVVPLPAPRQLPSRGMGRIADSEAVPSAEPNVAMEPAVALSTPPPASAATPFFQRPAVVSLLTGVAVFAAGASWLFFTRAPQPPALAEREPQMSMPSYPPQRASSAPPQPTEGSPLPSPSPVVAAPAALAPTATKPQSARRRRSRRARSAPSSGEPVFIESRLAEEEAARPAKPARRKAATQAEEQDPLLESLLAAGAEPMIGQRLPAEETLRPAGESTTGGEAGRFALPGLQRPVSASDRSARSPRPVETDSTAEGADRTAAATSETDQFALIQAHEQFDFCAQLLAQAAYGDHYDTCLCQDTRAAAPYRGRRGYYMSEMERAAEAGRLESRARILSSRLEGDAAVIRARWKSADADKGREATETWRLEDGLWCRTP